jgi:hypothetical protein
LGIVSTRVLGGPEIRDIVRFMGENPPTGTPQFGTAEFAGDAAGAACKACGRPIGGDHYRINGFATCAGCAQQIKQQIPEDSHSAFVRGVLFGIGAAILGLILYVGFALATGLMIGYVSLAVGYLVGKAIAKGSGGVGGRRYQIAAVLLTYSAVSLSAVPIAITQQIKHRSEQQARVADSAAAPAPSMNPVGLIGTLALIGLASPFLELSDPVHGIIGLVILFVGIRIAWKITAARQVSIEGPIRDHAPAPPG